VGTHAYILTPIKVYFGMVHDIFQHDWHNVSPLWGKKANLTKFWNFGDSYTNWG